jgi:two-component system LytT family sensor kinase
MIFVPMNKLRSTVKLIPISTIWLLPIILVMLESMVFVTKTGWGSPNIIYYISFWIIRILLTPFVIYYTRRFWVEHKQRMKLVATHLAGFLLFSIAFTTIAFFALHGLMTNKYFPAIPENSSNTYLYGFIADNSISINVMVYISTVVICYILEYSRRVVSANEKAVQLERSLVTSRLDLLKNQLNTHFLFNTLHTINSLVIRGEKEEASEMIIKLGDLLRATLDEGREQMIPLSKELEMLQAYIDIIKGRFGDKLEVKIIADEELLNCLVPAFVLQPLVENAVKHAIEPLTSKGRIVVDIKKNKNYLLVHVNDNGNRPFSQINFSNGIGLKNTKERLHQLYDGDYNMNFYPNEEDGITASLRLPLKTSAVYESINS